MSRSDIAQIIIVYKIMLREDWVGACRAGIFHGSADDLRDGFIHLSAGAQLAETAAKYFSGCAGLIVAAFDVSGLGDGLKWEPSRGGALFPHLYGPLRTGDALWTRDIGLSDGGVPVIPGDIA